MEHIKLLSHCWARVTLSHPAGQSGGFVMIANKLQDLFRYTYALKVGIVFFLI